MKIAVTGGTGFIGQYLIRDYSCKYEFVVLVRNMNHVPSGSYNVQYAYSDFTVEGLKKTLSDIGGVDVVVHLASKGMPKNQDPLRMQDYLENICITASIMEACQQLHIDKIIQASSKSVCSLWDKDVLSEEDLAMPLDEYGVSKTCSEVIGEFYNNVYAMNIITLRMAEVCGIDLTRGMLNPFWKILLYNSVNNLPIPIYGEGTSRRELIYVKDVTRAIDSAINVGISGKYNIATGKTYTNRMIAETFCQVFDNDKGVEFWPDKKEWGTSSRLSNDKIMREWNYETKFGLEDMVRDIKQEYELEINV